MNIVFAVMLMLMLLIGLFITGVPAGAAAQIPTEVREIANTSAFLASGPGGKSPYTRKSGRIAEERQAWWTTTHFNR